MKTNTYSVYVITNSINGKTYFGNNTVLKCSNGKVFNTTKEAERWVRENTPFSKATNSTILRSTKTGGRAYGFRWERA